jgi:hypothetical protein
MADTAMAGIAIPHTGEPLRLLLAKRVTNMANWNTRFL